MRKANQPQYREEVVKLPELTHPGKIGVVTVTFGSGSVLPDFLKSLKDQTYRNFVLIAVDNDSKDSTLEQLREFHDCELVLISNQKNVGVAAGNNQGIRIALNSGCEFVLLLNNDVAFGPELFQQLLDGMAEHACQMTTPIVYFHDRPKVIWSAGCCFQPWTGYRATMIDDSKRDEALKTSRRVQNAPTCCVLIKREVFEKVGLMDERYFVYHDDTDWMLRAYRAEESLYCLSHASLWHKVSSLSGANSPFQVRYGTRNRALMLVKFLGRVLAVPYTLAYRCLYVLRFVFGIDDWEMLRLKQSALSEGTAISGNWWPSYRRSRGD
jgi:GT2 family glycosyltransferase